MVALSKGSDLTVSSGAITPTHDAHKIVGGGGAIDTINPPSPDFCGFVVFFCESGNVSFNTGGNIARAIGINVGASVMMVYNPAVSQWFPVNA